MRQIEESKARKIASEIFRPLGRIFKNTYEINIAQKLRKARTGTSLFTSERRFSLVFNSYPLNSSHFENKTVSNSFLYKALPII